MTLLDNCVLHIACLFLDAAHLILFENFDQ